MRRSLRGRRTGEQSGSEDVRRSGDNRALRFWARAGGSGSDKCSKFCPKRRAEGDSSHRQKPGSSSGDREGGQAGSHPPSALPRRQQVHGRGARRERPSGGHLTALLDPQGVPCQRGAARLCRRLRGVSRRAGQGLAERLSGSRSRRSARRRGGRRLPSQALLWKARGLPTARQHPGAVP